MQQVKSYEYQFLLEIKMKLFVDLDGVITDFNKALSDLLGHPVKKDFGNDPAIWRAIDKAGENFWKNMSFMPDGHELWDYIKKYKPTVLTSPTRHPSSKAGKKVWLKEELPGVPYIIDSKKEQYAKDGYILIDDREKNIKKWEEAGGVGILHKDAESSIKKLKKIMEEKEKDAGEGAQNFLFNSDPDFCFERNAGAIDKLSELSGYLKSIGREVDAYQLERIADRWEDFLKAERMKSSPGSTLVEEHETPTGPIRPLFPDDKLYNAVIRTLYDIKATDLINKLRDLNQSNPTDRKTQEKKLEIMTRAKFYSSDVAELIGTLLSLRWDNRNQLNIRELESEIQRLSKKILWSTGATREERRSILDTDYPVRSRIRTAKQVKINPYDVVVQEAVQELGNNLQDVDVIQLENTCPGDRLAWVTNSDLIKGRPGKEKIIHLCLKKIKDKFKLQFGKEYAGSSPEDNRKMKELVKGFLVNIVLPHEYVHIQQELKNKGEFGPSPESEAERAEDWKAMEEFGIRRAMVASIDRIADRLELSGYIKEAYDLDIIANTMEKEADLQNYYEGIIDSVNKSIHSTSQIHRFLRGATTDKWPLPANMDQAKAKATAWKKALLNVVKNPGDILNIAKRLKMKSGFLAENTMPIEEWAELAKMPIQAFIAAVDSDTDFQPPPGNDGNPKISEF